MSETPPTLPPPGWYADPAGDHGSRWWDGGAWTDHVRAAPPSDDPPPPPADVAVAPDALPLRLAGTQRRIALAAAVVLVAGLVATVAVGLRTPSPADGDGRVDGAPLGQVLPGAEVPPPVDRAEAARRAGAAGCTTVVESDPLEDVRHVDPAEAPPPAALYPDRPANSGRHYGTILPLPDGTATEPIDERAVLHNVEHGSVVVWFDETAVGRDGRAAIADWRDGRADLGFTSSAGGALFATPMPSDLTDAAPSSGDEDPPAVALRAWGQAVDCERFDPLVADAFLAEHWGSHGIAPEADLSPYPEDSLRLAEPA